MTVVGKPFTSGYDPRRATGAANAGLSYKHWVNIFAGVDADDRPLYGAARLQQIAGDGEGSTFAKRMAAADCLTCDLKHIGKQGRREGADSTERILDRTDGKPTQRIDVLTQSIPPPAEAWADLLSALADLPDDQRLALAVSLAVGHVSTNGDQTDQTDPLPALPAGHVSTDRPDADPVDGEPAADAGHVSEA